MGLFCVVFKTWLINTDDLIKDCMNRKAYQTKEYKAIGSLNVFTIQIKKLFFEKSNLITLYEYSESREGVIIKCPLNDLFHNVVTVILSS